MGQVRTSRRLIVGATTVALAATPLAALTPLAAATVRTTAPSHVEVGLYGTTDPTYDGVYRQSLAILGLHAAGRSPRPEAVAWLRSQQCADGGFSSYNPDTRTPCPAFDPTSYTGGEDTNATAVAAQALLVVGAKAPATRAVHWLRGLQNADGGWEYTARAGNGSDPNSTGLVLTALSAAKVTAQDTPKSAVDYLASLQAGRADFAGTPAADRGGIASPYSAGAPDILSTVQAVPGVRGANLAALPALSRWRDGTGPAPVGVPPATATGVADWATHWLAEQVDAAQVTSSYAPWAVLSFAWNRTGEDAAYQLYADQVAGKVPATNPGANGQAALAAAVLGKSADVATYATRIASTLQRDTTAPTVSITKPTAPRKARSWKRLTVTAADAGSGVAAVKVAVTEKRATGWYSFNGKAWKRAKNGKAATWLTAKAAGATWTLKVPGLTRGRLVVRTTAADLAGNRSKVSSIKQKLTK